MSGPPYVVNGIERSLAHRRAFKLGPLLVEVKRWQLGGVVARGWLVEEATAQGSQVTAPTPAPMILRAALVRLGKWIPGRVRLVGTVADPAARPAWSTH